MTHVVNDGSRRVTETLDGAPWIRIFPVRTPTLPPATHTNVYALEGASGWTVIDPASPYDDEQAALDLALDGLTVAEIVLTHHHLDHMSGAAHLAARLGVGVAAHAETASRVASRVKVTRLIGEGDHIADTWQALHTPGHAPGHLCFHDSRSNALVAGDMVASIGTIIVEPDDGGDMGVYLDSLRRLRALGAAPLLPAHGPPISDGAGKLDFYIHHRLEREARVLAALTDEPRPVEDLLPLAYPEVPQQIWPLAARSLTAHLYKLEHEGRARRDENDLWRK